jgi:hypothetical protein
MRNHFENLEIENMETFLTKCEINDVKIQNIHLWVLFNVKPKKKNNL